MRCLKPLPAPLCASQTSHERTWEQIRAAVFRIRPSSRRLGAESGWHNSTGTEQTGATAGLRAEHTAKTVQSQSSLPYTFLHTEREMCMVTDCTTSAHVRSKERTGRTGQPLIQQ